MIGLLCQLAFKRKSGFLLSSQAHDMKVQTSPAILALRVSDLGPLASNSVSSGISLDHHTQCRLDRWRLQGHVKPPSRGIHRWCLAIEKGVPLFSAAWGREEGRDCIAGIA